MSKTRSFLALTAGAVALAFSIAGPTSAHASCDPGKPGDELSAEEAMKVYECLSDSLYKGYQKGDKKWINPSFAKDYRDWTLTSSVPGAPGFHGGRFLMTFVTEPGAEAYMQYKTEDVNIPAGTVIAKESFAVNDKGKARRGPLFFMEKVEAGKSPETLDWYYSAVLPNGKPLKVNVMKACNECHMENFGEQGGLGYPIEEARITR